MCKCPIILFLLASLSLTARADDLCDAWIGELKIFDGPAVILDQVGTLTSYHFGSVDVLVFDQQTFAFPDSAFSKLFVTDDGCRFGATVDADIVFGDSFE